MHMTTKHIDTMNEYVKLFRYPYILLLFSTSCEINKNFI
jgi:hypothetical protein